MVQLSDQANTTQNNQLLSGPGTKITPFIPTQSIVQSKSPMKPIGLVANKVKKILLFLN